jgi:hypothetical protein
MLSVLSPFLSMLFLVFRSRAALQVEILALRHQIGVLRRSTKKRPKLTMADRLFWAWLSGLWAGWRSALVIVKPETVIAWHRKGFRLFWTWKVQHARTGRPAVSCEVRQLIRTMSRANPLWGAPRIHGELLKLGIQVGETSVGKYMVRHRKPPTQTWRTFLENHVRHWSPSITSLCTQFASRCFTYSWSWPMNGGAFYISTSRLIRPRKGRPSNFAMRSPGARRLIICCETGIEFSATTSPDRFSTWVSNGCF